MTWAGWLGPALAKVRLHAIERRGETIAKSRRWYAPILIEFGNLYLRGMGAGVVVLRDRAWKAREIAMYRQAHGVECTVDSRGRLILPRWPGVILADYAGDLDQSPAERLRALTTASFALRSVPDHGDATLRNVLYDPATGRATWIDFDTAHEPSMFEIDRRADDLRALLYSAIEVAADIPVPDLFEAVRSGYQDPAAWEHLRDRLARGSIHSNTFHLAQASPPAGRRRALEESLGAIAARSNAR